MKTTIASSIILLSLAFSACGAESVSWTFEKKIDWNITKKIGCKCGESCPLGCDCGCQPTTKKKVTTKSKRRVVAKKRTPPKGRSCGCRLDQPGLCVCGANCVCVPGNNCGCEACYKGPAIRVIYPTYINRPVRQVYQPIPVYRPAPLAQSYQPRYTGPAMTASSGCSS